MVSKLDVGLHLFMKKLTGHTLFTLLFSLIITCLGNLPVVQAIAQTIDAPSVVPTPRSISQQTNPDTTPPPWIVSPRTNRETINTFPPLPDSFRFQNPTTGFVSPPTNSNTDTPNVRQRTLAVTGIHVGLYTGTLLLLNEAWYKDYPKSKMHTFNDMDEWLQVDKVGHTWSAFQLSRMSYTGWRWTGMPDKKAVWLAGASGFGFQTVVEILDGYSEEWGWSWGDFAANFIGSSLFVSQNLAWKEERISFKFGFHKMTYDDAQLNKRSDELFGSSLPERMLKDYNGQTYWLSANLKSFFKQSKLPPWLNMAVGYGATGMFGGTENVWTDPDTNQEIDRSDIPRRRQFYLAPDIDFTRIKTNSKWIRSLFYALNVIKIPAPTLMLSKGKLTVHGFYF